VSASRLAELLAKKIVLFEGGMGTLLQEHVAGLATPDVLTLDRPDVVESVHRAYAALADVIQTNTFGANRIKLESVGLAARCADLNARAVTLARAAARGARATAGGEVLVAGDMGPTGSLVEPLGELSFWQAYEAFREQAALLAEGGVDFILIETMTDLREAKAALLAAREATDLPVIITMTFDDHFTTPTGTDPATAANVLASMGAFAVGVNCSTGPEAMVEVVGRMAQVTAVPILAKPNAGLPELVDGRTVFRLDPATFAGYAEKLVTAGAGALGGCCGTTPRHIEALRAAVAGLRPVARSVPKALRLSSRVRTVEIGPGFPFAVVGERINPTNRDDVAAELLGGGFETVLRDARTQVAAGAHVLDVNVGVPGADEPSLMEGAVVALENAVTVPLSIDSVNPHAFEQALAAVAGKPLLNSVSGARERLDSALPLAARFGAGVVCLAMDERGLRTPAEERVQVLEGIVAEAERRGVPRENLILDCVTLAVSAEQEKVPETLRAVEMASKKLGLPTILGVSNVSHGLPDRSVMNASFLAMAMARGLDAAIMNPMDEAMMSAARASSVLTQRDRGSAAYVREHAKKRKKPAGEAPRPPDTIETRIAQAVFDGDASGVVPLVEDALGRGLEPRAVNDSILVPALEEVGRRFERREVYLPQMMLAAEAVSAAFRLLAPRFPKADAPTSRGTVVLATVEGDVHDIGKNILGSMLESHGYRVVDLGRNVPAAEIVAAAREHSADVVALSALMTTTVARVPAVIKALRDAGLACKVMMGGAVVTKRFADSVGADGYAKDAASAVGVLRDLLAGRPSMPR
jgi:5-methyltetrahydrofolate--homocysteine methyltransferase